MATSPNYNWPEPDNTDLVKNGALAIRTMGNAIDTTMATMTPKSTYTAKGSIAAATGASTPANLTVGANDLFLTAASGEATGLKWTGSWTSFTPTWTNLTVGNGTGVYKYQQIGKQVFATYKFTLGSTSIMGTNPNVTMPVNPASGSGGFAVQTLGMTKAGVGVTYGVIGEDTNKLYLNSSTASGTYVAGGTITTTQPFVWASGDFLTFNVQYEVA